MTPTEFKDICCTYLATFGTWLNVHGMLPGLAVVRTPEGDHYIKYTMNFFSVSTAGYGKVIPPRFIYFLGRGGTEPSTWLPDEAEKLLPYIKKGLILQLLADV